MSGTEFKDQKSLVATGAGAEHVEGMAKDAQTYVNNAARGTEMEHELTFMQAARKYPAAIGWTVVVCCAW